MTKDEALIEAHKQSVLPFCPLIKDTCNENCVCFVPARTAVYNGNNNWQALVSYCTHRDFQEE